MVIMGLCNGHFVPLMFALMSKKKARDYSKILDALPLTDCVQIILTDFEGASLKALKRKILELNLTTKVFDADFNTLVLRFIYFYFHDRCGETIILDSRMQISL